MLTTPRPYRWFALAAYLVGLTGQGAFCARVLLVGLEAWPETEVPAWSWIINAGWLILFGVQHSGMARTWLKTRLARHFPQALERSLYVGVSGLIVLGLALTWQPLPGEPLWRGPTWIVGIAVLGGGILGWCCLQHDHGSFMGLRQAWGKPVEETLHLDGLYRYVRHPLMLGMLLFLWGQPVMTPALAMLSAGMTVYILLALPLEERELARKFGPAYETYRQQAPALIPWRWPSS